MGDETSGTTDQDDEPVVMGHVVSSLADRVADYMATRVTPWRDEEAMREAVTEAVRLLASDASWEMARCIGAVNPNALVDALGRSEKPLVRLAEILDGIDSTEGFWRDGHVGWWETSTGAEFGAQKLREVQELVIGLADENERLREAVRKLLAFHFDTEAWEFVRRQARDALAARSDGSAPE